MHQTDKKFVNELDGLGRKMPVVFTCFTIAALGLMGVPGLAGFVSKWYLADAAVESGNVQAYLGIGCLLVSALLTAVYMLTIVLRAFFPGKDFDYSIVEAYRDPSWKMCLPLIVFAAVTVVIGLFSPRLVQFIFDIAGGVY